MHVKSPPKNTLYDLTLRGRWIAPGYGILKLIRVVRQPVEVQPELRELRLIEGPLACPDS